MIFRNFKPQSELLHIRHYEILFRPTKLWLSPLNISAINALVRLEIYSESFQFRLYISFSSWPYSLRVSESNENSRIFCFQLGGQPPLLTSLAYPHFWEVYFLSGVIFLGGVSFLGGVMFSGGVIFLRRVIILGGVIL